MITITFSAFSFLKSKLKEKNIECTNVKMEIPEGLSVEKLIDYIGLDREDVEAAFVNHRIMPLDTVIGDGDKIALVPPGGIPNHVAAYVGKNNK
ncbi:MAG: MoaD/ThiS family protein [Epsilonproteobacteria bacterium]|nr:MoaD/ThiS family protein [Campylobacterota bacterium]